MLASRWLSAAHRAASCQPAPCHSPVVSSIEWLTAARRLSDSGPIHRAGGIRPDLFHRVFVYRNARHDRGFCRTRSPAKSVRPDNRHQQDKSDHRVRSRDTTRQPAQTLAVHNDLRLTDADHTHNQTPRYWCSISGFCFKSSGVPS